MTILEAFASGLPVVASDLGAMSSLVDHRRTGLHFRPGDATSLAEQIEWISTHPAEWREMRRNARAEFDAKYTARKNYESLIQIYRRAIEGLRAGSPDDRTAFRSLGIAHPSPADHVM